MRGSILFVLALALSACAKNDDADTLRKSMLSWSATLRMVTDAWLRGEVPAGYARNTIEAAIEDLSGPASKLSLPRPLTLQAERIVGIAAQLERDVESNDRTAIDRARRELAAVVSAR
jgi:hypothetical protein